MDPREKLVCQLKPQYSFKKVQMKKHLFIFLSKYKALYLLRKFAHLYDFVSLLFFILTVLSFSLLFNFVL